MKDTKDERHPRNHVEGAAPEDIAGALPVDMAGEPIDVSANGGDWRTPAKGETAGYTPPGPGATGTVNIAVTTLKQEGADEDDVRSPEETAFQATAMAQELEEMGRPIRLVQSDEGIGHVGLHITYADNNEPVHGVMAVDIVLRTMHPAAVRLWRYQMDEAGVIMYPPRNLAGDPDHSKDPLTYETHHIVQALDVLCREAREFDNRDHFNAKVAGNDPKPVVLTEDEQAAGLATGFKA